MNESLVGFTNVVKYIDNKSLQTLLFKLNDTNLPA